ncbi:DUF4160 domain-containing protein [Cylindrospermopsis raciborskii]|uniref:DUF4160 domain-containing protein n=1 Tax=Cylindrospermopsis raciborskii TaxID=77022 RepID=UPI000E1E4DF7|nr:DUF4160 domain-containing protein [Cylindrospermopsis raciborskii Cr2010]
MQVWQQGVKEGICRFKCEIEINTGVVSGSFPKRALRHVLEWHDLHQSELLTNWQLCRRQDQPNHIAPLE